LPPTHPKDRKDTRHTTRKRGTHTTRRISIHQTKGFGFGFRFGLALYPREERMNLNKRTCSTGFRCGDRVLKVRKITFLSIVDWTEVEKGFGRPRSHSNSFILIRVEMDGKPRDWKWASPFWGTFGHLFGRKVVVEMQRGAFSWPPKRHRVPFFFHRWRRGELQ
jgi:hypothetical protein